MGKEKAIVKKLLGLADIEIGGTRPFDIQVTNEQFYKRILGDRELGLGESYMDGWWQVGQLDELTARLLSANLRNKLRLSPKIVGAVAWSKIQNRQTVRKSHANAAHHYDVGNDLYELMLDKRMIYSCAYWKDAATLDDAQEAKLELICKKLYLKQGMTLLDIGCGWGGFAEYVASKYKVKVTAITPAAEQVKLAVSRTRRLPVDILQKDYREVTGSYDRVVSIGVLEHVGPKNYGHFFRHCNEMLNKDGIMLHHTIGSNRSMVNTNPWIEKYIFPGGVMPSMAQINKAIENKLLIEDVHNFGPYYDKTLLAWHANFAKNYSKLQSKYDERFYRMWEFYLLTCAGHFRARQLQLWQIVMRKIKASEVYIAVR